MVRVDLKSISTIDVRYSLILKKAYLKKLSNSYGQNFREFNSTPSPYKERFKPLRYINNIITTNNI